jgi:hypothetical protein
MPLVFNYGSNSVSQLAGRLGNNELKSVGGLLYNHERIFWGDIKAWGGAVSSIVEVTGSRCMGSLVSLTDEEFQTLKDFEGGYVARSLVVQRTDSEEDVLAYAFVRDEVVEFVSQPSDAYLMAIWLHLRQHWEIETLHVNKFVSVGQVQLVSTWTPPPNPIDLPLNAFVVLLNNHKEKKWSLPRVIPEIEEKLGSIGIKSPSNLLDRLKADGPKDLNRSLVTAGQRIFSPNSLTVIESLLLGSC